jgi:curved DNA-binding protein
VEVPTPGGRVTLKVPAGTRAGQKLRLAGRGLSRPDGSAGHLYAVAQIAVPTVVDDRQRALFEQLKNASSFNPRAHMVD